MVCEKDPGSRFNNLTGVGPGSWLSVCSDPGVRWVISRTGTSGFDQIAHDLIGDWTKHLTLSQLPIGEKSPEPDFQTAWQYCTGAFISHNEDFLSNE